VSGKRLAAAVALIALAVFTAGINDHSFVDEYAYITQSYYSDLFFQGRWNDPAWLDYGAFDLPPLPKYFIGLALRVARYQLPGPYHAALWYRDSHTIYGPPDLLRAARIPFIGAGVLGCLALFAFGLGVRGPMTGALAALLLVANPLYRLHAHRSMSDVPCEAFLIAALASALWGFHRLWYGRLPSGLALFALAGLCSGLSLLCKFNGLLAPMVIVAGCGLGLIVPKLAPRAKIGLALGTLATIGIAFAMFLALNPSATARPRGRLLPHQASRAAEGTYRRIHEMVEIRLASSRSQQQQFSHNALVSPTDKFAVFVVQGFGRFGPLGPAESDSVIRYEWRQDWGLLIWMPLVLIGLVRTYRLGRTQWREGAPPSAFALLVWAGVAWVIVSVYLPMAWDRYLLPTQAPNALLVAVGLAGFLDRPNGKAVQA
jgi:4-amino-4-deoxy-L-arabinose transferase-like glycosyltransferase